jgi:hypothetical protein
MGDADLLDALRERVRQGLHDGVQDGAEGHVHAAAVQLAAQVGLPAQVVESELAPGAQRRGGLHLEDHTRVASVAADAVAPGPDVPEQRDLQREAVLLGTQDHRAPRQVPGHVDVADDQEVHLPVARHLGGERVLNRAADPVERHVPMDDGHGATRTHVERARRDVDGVRGDG